METRDPRTNQLLLLLPTLPMWWIKKPSKWTFITSLKAPLCMHSSPIKTERFVKLLCTYVLLTVLVTSLCLHSSPIASSVWISATSWASVMNPSKDLAWIWTTTAAMITSHVRLYTSRGTGQIVSACFPV